MCEAIGHPVTRLVRTRIGPIRTAAAPGQLARPRRRRRSRRSPSRRPTVARTPAGTLRARDDRRANVIGLGLIGGSIALGLREAGWQVSGDDIDPHASTTAGPAAASMPPDSIPTLTSRSSPCPCWPSPIRSSGRWPRRPGSSPTSAASRRHRRAVNDPRFVGGHPMAGSELDGLDGADAEMFDGAVWVLTPVAGTDDLTFARSPASSPSSAPRWWRWRPTATTKSWPSSVTSRTSPRPR